MFPKFALILSAASFAQAVVLTSRATVPFPTNGKADYQLGGPYTPEADVKIVIRDRTAPSAAGKYNICYINSFQTQPDERELWQGANDDLLLREKNGDYFEDPDWDGEFFLDTSVASKRVRLAAIFNPWIDACLNAGYQAIELDNLDTFYRAPALLNPEHNLALAKLLVDHAHSKGLLVAQKNTASELGSRGKDEAGFDFAIAEECEVWSECDAYTDVFGDDVIEIEYTDNAASAFTDACNARGDKISIIMRDRDVVPKGQQEYYYKTC